MHKPFVTEKAGHRPARFAQILKEELSLMIPGELNDPVFENLPFITITEVQVMPDLRNATILFSSLELDPENSAHAKRIQKIETALNKASGYLRHQLLPVLNTKVVPLLHFKFDPGFNNTMRVQSLLDKI